MYTARSKIVAHVKNTMYIFRQEKAWQLVEWKHTYNANNTWDAPEVTG